MQITVEHYQAERIPNPNPGGELSDEEFWRVRRAIVALCRRYGTVGPDDRDEQPACWVVDDQPNDELYQYVEVYERRFFSADWLRDLMALLRDFPGWGIGVINIRFAYLLIFGHKLMVTGYPFANRNDLESVAEAASLNLWGINGEVDRYCWERWHREAILASDRCGCFYCCSIFTPGEIRDWTDRNELGVGATAICPHCGNARIIATKPGFEIDCESLRQLSERAFGPFENRDLNEFATRSDARTT